MYDSFLCLTSYNVYQIKFQRRMKREAQRRAGIKGRVRKCVLTTRVAVSSILQFLPHQSRLNPIFPPHITNHIINLYGIIMNLPTCYIQFTLKHWATSIFSSLLHTQIADDVKDDSTPTVQFIDFTAGRWFESSNKMAAATVRCWCLETRLVENTNNQ